MAITTTAQLLSHPYQFLVETTEGTTPGAGSFTVAPPCKSISVKKDGGYVDVAQIGPEDLAKLVQGLQTFETSVVFYSSATAGDEAFFARAINAANIGTPAGTISETYSALIGFRLNNVVNYMVMKGTRAKSVSIKASLGNPHEITIEFVHTNIPFPTTAAPAGTTVSTTFNTGVINDWLSGGTAPVTVIGAVIDATEFNCTINRNTKVEHTLGNKNPHSSQPHGRRIAGDFNNLYTVVTNETAYDAATTGTILFVLQTATTTLTISTASLRKSVV